MKHIDAKIFLPRPHPLTPKAGEPRPFAKSKTVFDFESKAGVNHSIAPRFNAEIERKERFGFSRNMSAGRILLAIAFIVFAIISHAQQVEQFSLLQENAFILNPAMAGTEGYLHGSATFRKQFLEISRSPYTAVAALDGQLASKHIGLGGYLIDDVTGPTGKTGATFDFAYNLPLQKKYMQYSNGISDHILSFGVSASIVQYRLNASQLLLDNPNDPQLYNSNGYKIFPDASLGIYYRWKNVLYAGFSVPQMFGLNIDYRGTDGTAQIKTIQHLNALLGGKIAWAKDRFSIDPVAAFMWVKGAPAQATIGLRFTMFKTFWLGANYRTMNDAILQAGFNIKDFLTIAYSYDMNVANYRQYIGATHEINIGFTIPKPNKNWRRERESN